MGVKKNKNIPRRLRRRSFSLFVGQNGAYGWGVAYSLGGGYTESWIKIMEFVQITSFVKFGFFNFKFKYGPCSSSPHSPETTGGKTRVHLYREEKVRKSKISQFCATVMKNTTPPFERIQCTTSFPRGQYFEQVAA